MNPWKPPSGWDELAAEHARAPWTIRGVLDRVSLAFRRQPLGVLLAVCVLPGLWMVPAHLAEELFVSADEPSFGPGRSARAMAVDWATYAWESVWWAGELSAAIAAVRGQPIPWRGFITGLARAPILFLTTTFVLLPLEIFSFAPILRGQDVALIVEVLAFVVLVYASARTLLWQPLIVEARRPFWESLAMTLDWTRGRVLKLFALMLAVSSVTLPLFVVESVMFGGRWFVSLAVLNALIVLVVSAVYVEIRGAPGAGELGAVSAPANPGP